MVSIAVHLSLWGWVVCAATMGILVALRDVRQATMAGGVGLLGAGLGVVLFAILSGLVFPHNATNEVQFEGSNAQLAWGFLPPFLAAAGIGRVLSRSKPQASSAA